MGRFSPTVTPQAFDLGSVIDSFIKNFAFARGMKEDSRRTKRQERREDEQDAGQRDARRTLELSDPRARTLADYLSDPNSAEVTNLSAIGDASKQGVDINFAPPPPKYAMMPGNSVPLGGGIRMPQPVEIPQQSTFVTRSGVVMDPQMAGRRATLADALERQTKLGDLRDELGVRNEMGPWQPHSREERIDFLKDSAQATGVLGQRNAAAARAPGGANAFPRGLTIIQKEIDDIQQDINTQARLAEPPSGAFPDPLMEDFANGQRIRLMQMIEKRDSLRTEYDQEVAKLDQRAGGGGAGDGPDAPAGPPPNMIRRTAPGDTTGAGAGGGAAAGAADLSAYAPGGAAMAPDSGMVARAKKVSAAHPDWNADQVSEELRREDEEQAKAGKKK